ncbi:MAG: hypothetical protein GPOALKHO_000538 [Sodalis sp.]|nr:MAG: hypothetical protein GPOALKHO_000538 [Sodalis sp.]
MMDPIRPRIDFDSPMNEPKAPPGTLLTPTEGVVRHPSEVTEDDTGNPEALLAHALMTSLLALSSITQGIGAFVTPVSSSSSVWGANGLWHHRAGSPRCDLRRMAQALLLVQKSERSCG